MSVEAAINELYLDWMGNGFDDYLAWGFAVFEYTIRFETSALNHASSGDVVEVVIMGFEQVAGGLLLCQDWMLPLWGEFSEALARASARGINLECLSIGHIELPMAVLNVLAPSLKVAPIKLLHLKNNALNRDGILALSNIIKKNQVLERFALKEINHFDVGSVVSLVESSRQHNHLKSLSLDKCNIGLNSSLMSALLHTLSSSNVQNLSLSKNHIGTHESEMIATYLATNPPITSIDLADNLLSDADVMLIANALKSNTTLRGLRLSRNPIGMGGKLAICDAIYNVSSLDAIHYSNHTCMVTTDFEIPDCNRYVSRNANRISKLLGVLFTEYAFRFLDDVPLAVVPFVLDFVQYPSFQCPLTRIFHLMRDWEVPMENLIKSDKIVRKRKRAVTW
jgi:hypothetical protein